MQFSTFAAVYSNTTTVITITSCDEVCTETIEGVVTEYTTYCPLSTEETPATVAPTTKAPATEETSTVHATETSTLAANGTTYSVTSYEGAAVKALPAFAAVHIKTKLIPLVIFM
ncbi:uncharacterized protein CYBJADRAFT_25727 [Cyberlindnera jadinii NRRL Y-1542]|uniref:Uncharacterized protein n=1 Tax=Cyberlindnera jadinii (strain ATCC 18201 / CBS 1600 / BCRC 20928 / JCM 3617 / NBRC 0987 / NRRL Y-1542) TaxID=983966 RepID=A0A1E4RXF3_CYBJN|nr:hypothetical protein CYBJADRAFT_25727 [Cyberlindnera jadinii NRRL Y-1542]ODV71957.1 hypothetical protein CYBJADRAFT_25727 [Cyberlindnera jadinii NRRL Y-1542]